MKNPEYLDFEANDNVGNISFRMEVGEKVMAIILALSIAVNVGCWYVINQLRVEKRLQEYDLDYFKSTDFATLKGEVNSHDALIKAFGISTECRRANEKR